MIQRYHVAAGTYVVSESKPLLLQAYLGTCVGLSLYCKSTGIGGMVHLLLPEPISPTSVDQPEKYASLGVPLLIESVLAKGARQDSLFACVAGGALVGPISNQDLALDIGGRTAETTRAILAARNIKLIKSETGGFFTCCLSLNMATGESTIEPAGHHKLVEEISIKTPTQDEIRAAMDHLQPIPQVALKALRLIDEGGHDLQQIADEVRKDQVITARSISLANSAMFAKKRPIETLDHALIFLGRDQLVKLILMAAVQSYFEQSAMGYSLCKGGLYHHAVGCALVAEILARTTEKVDPQIAYTAALLHDIGKVVLDQYVAQGYPLFYRQTMEKEESFIVIERRLLGMDHTEVGELLGRQWQLPDSLIKIIRYHHQPDRLDEEHKQLAIIVYLSDLLLSRFHIGFELERLDTEYLTDHLDAVDLTATDFNHLVDLIPNPVLRSITETNSFAA